MPNTTDLDQPAPSSMPTPPLDGITELEDGSVIVQTPDDSDPVDSSSNFYANLVPDLGSFELNTLASDLLELIDRDKEARKERDKTQEEGIRRTGLGDDAPGGATFDGASKIVHPVLAEGCVDFSARAIKELFPSNGPVRTKINGESNEAALEKAKNKRDFLNFYLIERMPEYRSEKETLLTQLPLGGSQYEKYYFGPKRIRMEFVPIDKLLLPFSANSFYTANRITHVKDLTEEEIDDLVEDGFYEDVFGLDGEEPEETSSQKATDKIEGKESSGYNEDGVRTIYEVTCNINAEGDGIAPYVIHIDVPTEKICAIYRNWKESDEEKTRLDWWVEDKFIPWRGAYGIGLPHLIGGLSAALTGALRALLDSAHINNAPTAIKLKGGRASGQNISLDMTAVTEIEAPANVSDIRNLIMPMPFNPPSQVLFNLLDWITTQAKSVVATAEEAIADAGSNMPVGTSLALIEQGSQVFSSIHARLHDSQRRALKIICRLIADNPEHAQADLKKFGLTAEDFLDSDDIAPVSDPNIFSETQRYAQMQAVIQMASGDAQDPSIPWNKLAIRRRMLETLRIDGVDELLPKPKDPITADPASENVAMMQGLDVKAMQQQDHDAHIKTHLMFILQPFIAQGPNISGQALAKIMDHIAQHQVLDYAHMVQACQMLVQKQQPGLSPDQLSLQSVMMAQDKTSQAQQGISQLIAEAMQVIQSKTPPPPIDPAIQATKDVAMAQIQQKQQADQAQNQLKAQELQMQPTIEKMKLDYSAQLEAQTLEREDIRHQYTEQMAAVKAEVADQKKQITELLIARDNNETTLQAEMLKLQGLSAAGNVPTPNPSPPDIPSEMGIVQDKLNSASNEATTEAANTVAGELK